MARIVAFRGPSTVRPSSVGPQLVQDSEVKIQRLQEMCAIPGRVDVNEVGLVAHAVGLDQVGHVRLVQHADSRHVRVVRHADSAHVVILYAWYRSVKNISIET